MTLVSLSLFLGMFSFFFGLLKISRSLNYDIHREIRRNFVRYAKVMPFVRYFGWSFSSKYYRLLIGWFEIILGALLAFCPGRTKQIANLLLICITFGAIYTHYAIEDDFNSKQSRSESVRFSSDLFFFSFHFHSLFFIGNWKKKK